MKISLEQSLSIDWARHINVSEKDDDDDKSSDGFDVDALSASVSYRF
jgi:hypothetical protein